VARRIATITSQLDTHLQQLRSTVWEGNAKESAVSAVTSFTTAAKNRAGEAQQSISSYIQDQIDDVLAKDR
jgi:hypothetical protein